MTTQNLALYLVNLEFQSEVLGGGSMQLKLAVNPTSPELMGRAEGVIQAGTQNPPKFTADVSGHTHSTGFGSITKIGAVSGTAGVFIGPAPVIGSYFAPFSATFAVDADWNGTGQFSVGADTYECKVTAVEKSKI